MSPARKGTLLAAAILLLGVSFLAGSALWQRLQAQDQLSAYLPAAGGSYLSLKVNELRRAGLLNASPNLDAEYRNFIESTNFRYEKDLDELYLYLSPDNNYYLARGRFDWNRLRAYALSTGGRCVDRVCSLPSSQPGKFVSYYPLRENVIALALSPDPFAASLLSEKQTARPSHCQAAATGQFELRREELRQWFPMLHSAWQDVQSVESCLYGTRVQVRLRFADHLSGQDLTPGLREFARQFGASLTSTGQGQAEFQWDLDKTTLNRLFTETGDRD